MICWCVQQLMVIFYAKVQKIYYRIMFFGRLIVASINWKSRIEICSQANVNYSHSGPQKSGRCWHVVVAWWSPLIFNLNILKCRQKWSFLTTVFYSTVVVNSVRLDCIFFRSIFTQKVVLWSKLESNALSQHYANEIAGRTNFVNALLTFSSGVSTHHWSRKSLIKKLHSILKYHSRKLILASLHFFSFIKRKEI